MVTRVTHNFIKLLLCVAFDTACLAVSFFMVIANYLACQVSFELIGYDKMPLYRESLLGSFFGAFVGQATLTHLYALMVSVALSVALFAIFHFVFRIFDLWRERKLYLYNGQENEVSLITHNMMYYLILLSAFTFALVWAVRWDVELFRYRSIAGALALEDPSVAVELPNWALQIQENSDLWFVKMADIGAWGYIAITAIACMCLEYTLQKTGEYWARLLAPLDEWLAQKPQEDIPLFFGYDQNGEPVYDPDTPVAYDTDGNPLGGEKSDTIQNNHEFSAAEKSDREEAGDTAQSVYNSNSSGESMKTEKVSRSLFDPDETGDNLGEDIAKESDRGQEVQDAPNENTEEYCMTGDFTMNGKWAEVLNEVIGDSENQRVSLSEAQANPERYWIDPDNHSIWDAAYRRTLFGEKTSRAA